MKNQKKNFVSRLRLLPEEPFEMTYWKKKLNSPFHKMQMAIKHWWMHLTQHEMSQHRVHRAQ